MDPFFDPRIAAAEAGHARRRRRSNWIYGTLAHLFHLALLLAALAVVARFLDFIRPYLG